MDLSKKDKKAIRVIIDKGIQQEFNRGMQHFDLMLQQWRDSNDKDQEHYAKLYGAIKTFDKKIAQRYDYLSGSSYLHTIVMQLFENMIDKSDLETLSTEAQSYILRTVENLKG